MSLIIIALLAITVINAALTVNEMICFYKSRGPERRVYAATSILFLILTTTGILCLI